MDDHVIKLHTPQLKVFISRKPLTLNMAGQRAGKSHLIGVKSGFYVLNAPKIKGMIAANTYMQLTQSTMVAVRKVWEANYGLVEYDPKGSINGNYVIDKKPPSYFTKHHEFHNYKGIVSFANGAIIFLASLDNFMAHDGKEIGWAELDETKDTKEEALKAVILARLSQPGLYYQSQTLEIKYLDADQDTTGYIAFNPCCINTSPAVGVVKWLTDLFNLQDYEKEILKRCSNPKDFYYNETSNQAVCIYSTYWNEHNLPDNYIEIRLSQLSEGEGLKYIYGYPFARTGDNYYRNFEKAFHVFDLSYMPKEAVHVTFDFNSKPYMTMLIAQVFIDMELGTFTIGIFKEYCLASPKNSTEAVCIEFRNDFLRHDPFVFYYGDASGDYRQAGSGDHTQFDTVRDVLRPFISHSSDRVPKRNKSVLNRRDFIDRILENKQYIQHKLEDLLVQLNIDPSCENTIEDFQWLKEGIDGKVKEQVKDPDTGVKYEKLGHCSDAVEYLVCEMLMDYYS